MLVCPAAGADDPPVGSRVKPDGEPVQIGLDGLFRVGRWAAISGTPLDAAETISVTTEDGDGVEVQFMTPPVKVGDQDRRWAYAKPGAQAAPLRVSTGDRVVVDRRFPIDGSLRKRPVAIADSTPWVVVLGDTLGIDQLGVNVIRKDPIVAVSRMSDASMLPDRSIGYDGVDLLVIGGGCQSWIGDLSRRQQTAMTAWVRGGGRVLWMLGGDGAAVLSAAPWMAGWLPFDADQIVQIDPAGLESFTASQTPLTRYSAVRLPKNSAGVLIRGRTTRRISTSLATRFVVGFGEVTVVAADLDRPPFVDWPERMDLIHRLTGNVLLRQTEASAQMRGESAAGYDDLSGQLRIAMDQYPSAVRTPFSVISLIIMALVAAIGPLDYWLVNRVLGRPLLGWLTFPITAVGLSSVLAGWAMQSDPNPTEHRIEVVDLDLTGGSGAENGSDDPTGSTMGRTTVIGSMYTPSALRIDGTLSTSNWVGDVSGANGSLPKSYLTQWSHPSAAFGGVQVVTGGGAVAEYRCRLSGNGSMASVDAFPIAPRSSKSYIARADFLIRDNLDNTPRHGQRHPGGVLRRRGSELLEGELSNPLPVDILDGRLIYQNWVYLLPTRFAAGSTIAQLSQLREKNFRSLLSRQRVLESGRQSEAWRGRDQSIDRILEMMMYHDAAGGTSYTSLQHRMLGELDLSGVLQSDRCLLVGRIDRPAMRLNWQSDNGEEAIQSDWTGMVRVVLPATLPR